MSHYKSNIWAKKVLKKQKGSRAPNTNFDTVPRVPPQKIALAQLLFAYTNTYSSKTPLCHVCHVLFLDRKKNNCSRISLIVAQVSPCFCHNRLYF